MSPPERPSLRSPLRSPQSAVSAIRGFVRRRRLGRLTALVVAGTFVLLQLFGALDAASRAQARWAPDAVAWTVTVDIAAGSTLEPHHLAVTEVPPGLLPSGAVTADPSGARARVDLAAGEIVLQQRIGGDLSVHAARTPVGAGTIALDRTSDLFAVGDRVDLHDQVDGARLATDALVVAVTDGDVAVAVDDPAIAQVIRGMGRGGVVAVLRSG